MQGTRSEVVSLLASVIDAEVGKTITSFLSHLSWAWCTKKNNIPSVAVVTGNQGGIFATRRSSIGNGVGRVNTSRWGGVLASLLSISATLFLFLLLLSLLVRALVMFGTQGMWVFVWGQSVDGSIQGSRVEEAEA